jgi:hypothetical protein
MNDGSDIISYETIVTNGDELVFTCTALWFSHGRHFQLQQTFEAFGRRRAAANTAGGCGGLEEAVWPRHGRPDQHQRQREIFTKFVLFCCTISKRDLQCKAQLRWTLSPFGFMFRASQYPPILFFFARAPRRSCPMNCVICP